MISIDGGGNRNKEVNSIASSFYWKYGKKEIIEHKENLGLRDHVISCGNLTCKFENLIILEEDCFVSRNYFNFAVKALSFFYNEKKVAGISLYSYNYNESFGTPFIPVADGNDNYFMQVPSSLGQVWTRGQWSGFKAYYNLKPAIDNEDKIPEKVKTWPESSWKKIFYKYLVVNDLFFVYPYTAFTSNFGDSGTNLSKQTQAYQVAIEHYDNKEDYNFLQFDSSKNKYDAYFEILPDCLIAKGVMLDTDTCIDIMGSKPLHLFTSRYALSSKSCTHSLKSFDNALIPLPLNVLYQLEGDSIHYGLRGNFGNLLPFTKIQQIVNAQWLGFFAGKLDVITGKYYKLGFYLLNPIKIPRMLKRKLLK